jgi:hypothetical protein
MVNSERPFYGVSDAGRFSGLPGRCSARVTDGFNPVKQFLSGGDCPQPVFIGGGTKIHFSIQKVRGWGLRHLAGCSAAGALQSKKALFRIHYPGKPVGERMMVSYFSSKGILRNPLLAGRTG